MAGNEFHFVTHWRFESSVEEVTDILSDALGLVRWWPSVYLNVQELTPGATLGVGKEIGLCTKGWLPYTLHWQFRVTEVSPTGFALDATGDFVGRGVWAFRQEGPTVAITYDWRIRADKPLLRYLSFVMKPIFSANHEWAMRMGEKSLRLELARRKAATSAERAKIAPPPGPTFRFLLSNQ